MGEILVDKFLSLEMKKALNRRGFVRNLGLAGAALAGTGLLSACGGSSSGSSMMTAQGCHSGQYFRRQRPTGLHRRADRGGPGKHFLFQRGERGSDYLRTPGGRHCLP